MRYFVIPFGILIALFVWVGTKPVNAVTPLYPNLKTLPPKDLKFDREFINGLNHYVLRFSNTAWNTGEGPLELRGETISSQRTKVYQRIYDDSGGSTEQLVGEFVFHPTHNHWHFENFAEYEIWTKPEYDSWIASGRVKGQAQKKGSKTTFCIMDTALVQSLAGSPSSPQFSSCGQILQGLSVGWGDTYRYSLPEQWIDLGTSRLPDGQYVLRSVVDPKFTLTEASSNQDLRESPEDNEAITPFQAKKGRIIY